MALRFEDQLFLYLPEAMRASDTQELRSLVETVTTWGELVNRGETGIVQRGQLERISRMLGLWLDRYRYILDSLPTFWDADNVDIDFLPYLSEYLGWELDRNLNPAEQRKIVRQAVALYKIKGTRKAYTAIFTAIGFDLDIQEFEPSHRFRLNAITSDNLNTLQIPVVDKLLRQIEWMRPINAILLGLRFTKYLPEYFDEDLQTWVGSTEYVGVTDSFDKYFIKRMTEPIQVLDTISGSSINGFFYDSDRSSGLPIKYDGTVKYGNKFGYTSANRIYWSEDLAQWSKTASITTLTSGVTTPAGASSAWNVSKAGVADQYISILYSGYGTTTAGQRWGFSCWLSSGTGEVAELQIVSSGLAAGVTSGIFTALSNFVVSGRSYLESETFTTSNHNIEVRVYPDRPHNTSASAIVVSSPQLELVQSGVKPNPSLYIPTSSGAVVTKSGHYPTMYLYNHPILPGGFPSEGIVLWLIRATDGTIISRSKGF